MKNVLDIDRLHEVIDAGENVGRGEGYTFAKCHQIAGYIEIASEQVLNLPTFVCLTKGAYGVTYVRPLLQEVLCQHGMKLIFTAESQTDLVLINPCKTAEIRYLGCVDLYHLLRGHEAVIFPMEANLDWRQQL